MRHAQAVAQITAEFEAQAERLDAKGLRVDHLDSHQHIHMIPAIFAVAARWAAARRIALRIADERFRRQHFGLRRGLSCLANGGLIKKAILNYLARRAGPVVPSVIHAGHYFGVLETGRITADVLREIVDSLPQGVSEINCHPGLSDVINEPLACSRADRHFLASPHRQMELAALVDQGVRAKVLEAGVRLARFGDVPKG